MKLNWGPPTYSVFFGSWSSISVCKICKTIGLEQQQQKGVFLFLYYSSLNFIEGNCKASLSYAKNGNEVVNVEEDIWNYLESQCLKIPQKDSLLLLSLHNVPCCKTPYLERLSLTIQQTKQIILSQISRRANNATADELIMHYKLVCCWFDSSRAYNDDSLKRKRFTARHVM